MTSFPVPCYEAETVELLEEIQERAEQGDPDWLKQHGKEQKMQ